MKRIVWLTISRETSGLYLERQEDCFFFVDFNLISQVSVRFFLVWQSDDDEILDYYIVKVVTIACEFRISINTTTVTFFISYDFFVISLKIIEIHGKIISFAYRGGLM